MLNLDAHLVVAVLDGSLNNRETSQVSTEPLAISPIVLSELAKLAQLGRLKLDFEAQEFKDFLRLLNLISITLEIARKSTELDFQSAPADEIIATTSIVERIPLLTRDRKIRKSKLVPLA